MLRLRSERQSDNVPRYFGFKILDNDVTERFIFVVFVVFAAVVNDIVKGNKVVRYARNGRVVRNVTYEHKVNAVVGDAPAVRTETVINKFSALFENSST